MQYLLPAWLFYDTARKTFSPRFESQAAHTHQASGPIAFIVCKKNKKKTESDSALHLW